MTDKPTLLSVLDSLQEHEQITFRKGVKGLQAQFSTTINDQRYGAAVEFDSRDFVDPESRLCDQLQMIVRQSRRLKSGKSGKDIA